MKCGSKVAKRGAIGRLNEIERKKVGEMWLLDGMEWNEVVLLFG